MTNRGTSNSSKTDQGGTEEGKSGNASTAPAISLPKGGGAIRGIGEKFAANPVTGTGSMTVPIAVSPGRSGFGPQLAFSYDSGGGNGPFGLGWSLGLPQITRKTDKGLPRYRDTEDSDVFILSGAEDLVPVYRQDIDGSWVAGHSGYQRDVAGFWVRDADGKLVIHEDDRIIDAKIYHVRRYRPRIEGLFARIERWTNSTDAKDVFWRSISKDNITTFYGRPHKKPDGSVDTNHSRIADPADPTRIYSWLICESHDDKGNVIVYDYESEDSARIFEDPVGKPLSKAHERNRSDQTRSANRYLKRIRYGNHAPYFPQLKPDAAWPQPPGANDADASQNWLFEVVVDYGEGHYSESLPNADGRVFAQAQPNAPTGSHWPVRNDPFSSCRAGFEVRTYRLCQRVLMFHHFADQLDANGKKVEGYDGLVRSTDFHYSHDKNPEDSHNPIFSLLLSVTHSGYKKQIVGIDYLKKYLPPVEFTYSEAIIQEQVREVDAESLENLPSGLDGSAYQWVDLDGEGLSGILTEQAGGWFYKRNLSPINTFGTDGSAHVEARFAPIELVASKPALSLAGHGQFMDLAGVGKSDLVSFDAPVRGFYERNDDLGWEPFRPFRSFPNLDTRNPNLKFIDLDGDGHSDILITEDEVFRWHASLAEDGFSPSEYVRQSRDEETGPRLIFADAEQSIYLADFSGDGLTDLVRIRNGEVCYWPNLSYGRFGAKVTMDKSPWFDRPDQFDQKRIRLADIDGSGLTDIIYLHGDGVRIYFNQSGNSWSKPPTEPAFPHTDNLSSVQVADLLGNGTSCLVWSSPLPSDARRPMRYIDLMGGIKPHLLVKTVNNLGAETAVSYAPSTKFYLQDQQVGKPWVTKLPFPVYCVERVETWDHLSRNRFVTRYSYHHGFFDGFEREFRGFGRVEQFDTEEIGVLRDNSRPAENESEASYVPPIHTKTWFHTGAWRPAGKITESFREEYWREDDPAGCNLDDTVFPLEPLSIDEEREACRALRGSMLRQEVYAKDRTNKAQYPYTVTEQNFAVERTQPRAGNRHAVFFTHARETISCHYERSFTFDPTDPEPDPKKKRKLFDPRVSHALTLEVDRFGNVLKQAAIGYGRLHPDTLLLEEDCGKQALIHITCTESAVTNAIDDQIRNADGSVKYPDDYRIPLPFESRTFELRKAEQEKSNGGLISLYRFDDLKQHVTQAGDGAHDIHYEDLSFAAAKNAVAGNPTEKDSYFRRLIEHVRTLNRTDDLSGLLPLGELQPLALPGESYKLAFTPGLLSQVFQRPHPGNPDEPLLPEPNSVLAGPGGDQGGYVRSQTLKADGRFPATNADGYWWIPSGQTLYSDNPATELSEARKHFFLARLYRDPFGHETFVDFDAHDLLMAETRDALGNRVTVDANDYRVLQPRLVSDPNRNQTEVAFDALGMVVGTAIMGKSLPAKVEGDTLTGFIADPLQADLDQFMAKPRQATANLRESEATQIVHDLLQGATTRVIYDLDRYQRTGEPPFAATIARETHVSDLQSPQKSKLQVSFSYSDGFGREIQKKVQAEPGPAPQRKADGTTDIGPDSQPRMTAASASPRWVGSGWTIFNNKGKPVRQFEPFFSDTHKFDADVRFGVSPVLFYDPAGRVVATLHPNHTWEKVVFDPWLQETWDVNDTVLVADPKTDPAVGDFFRRLPDADYLPTWHARRQGDALGAQEQTAASKTAIHAATPTVAHADSLGRTFLTVAHSKSKFSNTLPAALPIEEFHCTRVELDIEGNQRAVRDPIVQSGDQQGRVVMRYDYDMLGNRIHQLSMEAGARWMLNDVAGKPIRAWDSRGHRFATAYDALRRPVEQTVRGTTADSDPRTLNRDILVDRIEYGEGRANAEALNLRTRTYRHFDSAGIATNARLGTNGNPVEAYDFKGNLLRSTRRLATLYKEIPDWSQNPRPQLDAETFEASTRYDGLNRPIQSIAPHGSLGHAKRNVIQPVFNEANLLERMDVWLEWADPGPNQLPAPDRLLNPNDQPASPVGVANIDYDAKGQRLRIDYKNGATTRYRYDAETFRLMHLYTRRGAAFTGDCDNPQPPPATIAAPETAPQGKPCGLQNLHYTYDPAGNITHIQDDAQQTIYFNQKRVEPSNDYTYDALYRLIEASGREHLGQQANGDRNPPTAPDAFNTLHTRLDHPGNGQAMGTYIERYIYDAVGNFLQMQHRGSDPAHAGWTRAYDYLEPSLIENGIGGAPLKTSNRLTRTTLSPRGTNPQPDTYQHDPHGNMTRMPHLPLMQWDYRDQLQATAQQVINHGTPETTWYVYDSAGQRVRKVTETAVNAPSAAAGTNPVRLKERIYLGGFELYREFKANGTTVTLERETLHIMDDKQRIALVETRTDKPDPEQLIRYQFGNHLGSASLELDDEAKIISYEEYNPYGSTSYQAVRSQTKTAKRYRYTGKERDEESGLYYHGARYYAPWVGRWSSCDPVGMMDGSNLYAYVRNRPVKLVDRTGLAGVTKTKIKVGHEGQLGSYNSLNGVKINGNEPTIREHTVPGSQLEALTKNPLTGVGDYRNRGPEYRGNTVYLNPAAKAAVKTPFDNARTSGIKQLQQCSLEGKGSGAKLNEHLLLPSIEGAVNAQTARGVAEKGALSQAGELFGLQTLRESGTKAEAFQQQLSKLKIGARTKCRQWRTGSLLVRSD